MANSTLQAIMEEMAKAIAPVKDALASQQAFIDFMKKLGWDVAPLTQLYTDLKNLLQTDGQTLWTTVTTQPIAYSTLKTQVKNLSQKIQAMTSNNTLNLGQYTTLGPTFVNTFPEQLLDYLVYKYFDDTLPKFTRVLRLADIFSEEEAVSPQNISYTHYEVKWDNLKLLVTDPKILINNIYNFGQNQEEFEKILSNFRALFESIGLLYQFQPIDVTTASKLEDATITANDNRQMLVGLFHLAGAAPNQVAAGAAIYPLPMNAAHSLPGLAILPILKGSFTNSGKINLFNSVYLEATTNLSFGSNDVAILFRPEVPAMKVMTGLPGTGPNPPVVEAEGDITIAVTNEDASGNPIVLFGTEGGTNLQYKTLSLTGNMHISTSGKQSVGVELNLTGGELQIKPGEGDSFLKAVLPANGLTADFEFTAGYDTEKGLYFKGGAGLEVEIPIHKKLLGIDFESVKLSIDANANNPNTEINVAASTSFTLEIGPIVAVVKDIGVKGTFTFPGGKDGNLGPVNLDLSFKQPSGVGISINANPVSGGGFLNYDEKTSTYTGALEFSFSKISFKAIGMLSTKLPDGSDGYSLLIIVTSEFTPIQLGMGFTLNGVGGLLGWNRTVNVDRLRSGIKDKTLDSILFPQDIVKNAATIISNVGQAFPVKKDRFLIGPMAKIGWGTPTLLTIELGVVIELPSPVMLTILGIIKTQLPSENNKILTLQVNFVGQIDFGKQYLWFDATLFESKVLNYPLSGDMAVRLYWGDKPAFLLSVGGFHPKFTPPPMNLPKLNRIAVQLATGDVNIRAEGYFAVTSNSAQFGARIDASAKAWKIVATGALWFDVLFQFAPFYFSANMGATFSVKMGSKEIMSLYVDFNLEGPNPWRAQGKASFKILLVRVNVSFDKTFGAARVEAINPVSVFPLLSAAIQNKDNWQIATTGNTHQTVAYREIPVGAATDIVIDPFGSVQFNQKVVPLRTAISKYGTSKISDYDKFSIDPVQLTGSNPLQTLTVQYTQDFFARNEFFYMTEDEKLSKDSYEKYDSGFVLGSTDQISMSYYNTRNCEYDEIIIDNKIRAVLARTVISNPSFRVQATGGYISNSPLSPSAAAKLIDGPLTTQVEAPTYLLMNRNTMQQVSLGPSPGDSIFMNATHAETALNGLLDTNYAVASDYIIINSFELQTL